MSLAAEKFVHEDAPDPAMLRRLASVCVSLAASREMLKSPPKFVGSHYFIAAVSALDTDTSILAGQMPSAEPVEIWDRLAGRVGRVRHKHADIKLRQWSLKVYHTHASKREGLTWLSAQTLYRFEWDDQRTLTAERRLRLVDAAGAHGTDIDDMINAFHVPEYMASIWHAEVEMARVTRHECEEIIEHMTGYFNRLD